MSLSLITLWAGRVAAMPSTLTAPDRISDCARSRVSASPRRTSATSSRSRRAAIPSYASAPKSPTEWIPTGENPVLRYVFVEIFAQLVLQFRLAQLTQRGRLDLPHTLARHAELIGNLAHRVLAPA